MLLSLTQKWYVVTLTKTGTHTLMSALKDDTVFQPNKHEWVFDIPGHEGVTRVRNPYDRWVSTYWYNLRQKDRWGWGPLDGDINDWAANFWTADRNKRPGRFYMVTCSQAVHEGNLKWFKEIDDMLEYLGFASVKAKRLNATKDRPSVEETMAMLTERNLQQLHEYCKPDCEEFGYAPA